MKNKIDWKNPWMYIWVLLIAIILMGIIIIVYEPEDKYPPKEIINFNNVGNPPGDDTPGVNVRNFSWLENDIWIEDLKKYQVRERQYELSRE